jgi:hypothetical protein
MQNRTIKILGTPVACVTYDSALEIVQRLAREPWPVILEPSFLEAPFEPLFVESSSPEPRLIGQSFVGPRLIGSSFIEPRFLEPPFLESPFIEPSFVEPLSTDNFAANL